jgi:hypothetical protein
MTSYDGQRIEQIRICLNDILDCSTGHLIGPVREGDFKHRLYSGRYDTELHARIGPDLPVRVLMPAGTYELGAPEGTAKWVASGLLALWQRQSELRYSLLEIREHVELVTSEARREGLQTWINGVWLHGILEVDFGHELPRSVGVVMELFQTTDQFQGELVRYHFDDIDHCRAVMMSFIEDQHWMAPRRADVQGSGHHGDMDLVLLKALRARGKPLAPILRALIVDGGAEADLDLGDGERRIELRMVNGQAIANLPLSGGAVWSLDVLTIRDRSVPEHVAVTGRGRRLGDIVNHPCIPEELLIQEVDQDEHAVRFLTMPDRFRFDATTGRVKLFKA